MRSILATLLLISSFSSFATTSRVFKMTKNISSANFMVIDANLDANCKLLKNTNGKFIDYYWLMGGKTRAELTSMEHGKFKPIIERNGASTRLVIKLEGGKLDKFTDDGTIVVESGKDSRGGCGAWGYVESDRHTVRLHEIKLKLGACLKGLCLETLTISGVLKSDNSAYSKKIND